MSYQYYQNLGQGWGTPQYQFGPPPQPNFQPQPSWSGYDFYNAHAMSPDPSLYDYALDRARNYVPSDVVGRHEAKHWHQRVYGGLSDISLMLPQEIGYAAAYEAYRSWRHHSFIHEPLSSDRERQREGLVGLAVAEATRMWHLSGRTVDRMGRRLASEAAAETASMLFDQMDGYDGGYGHHHRSSYSGSFGHRSRSPSPYAYDDDVALPESYPHHSRLRRHSSTSRPAASVLQHAASAVPFSTSPSARPPMGLHRRPSVGSFSSATSPPLPMPAAVSYNGSSGYAGGSQYGSSPPAFPGGFVSPGQPSSYGGMYPAQTYSQPNVATSYPMASPNYAGQPAYASPGQPMAVPAGSTIIIQKQPRHRSSSHRHKHRERRHSLVGYNY